MAIINVEDMFAEVRSLMINNCGGTIEQRYEQAKRIYLENINSIVEQNKEGLIEDCSGRLGGTNENQCNNNN